MRNVKLIAVTEAIDLSITPLYITSDYVCSDISDIVNQIEIDQSFS